MDPVVDPSCRGQGVFSLMLSWLLDNLDGVQLLYNFANPVSAPGFLAASSSAWGVSCFRKTHIICKCMSDPSRSGDAVVF